MGKVLVNMIIKAEACSVEVLFLGHTRHLQFSFYFYFFDLPCYRESLFLLVASAHAYFIHFNPKKHQHYLFMKANAISNEVIPICLHQAGDPQQCLNLKLILSKYTTNSLHNCTPLMCLIIRNMYIFSSLPAVL